MTNEKRNFNTFWACKMHGNHASLRCAICDENKLIELQAKVEDLTARLSASRANVGLLQAKVEKLKYLREGDERIRIKLQAKVDDLEAENELSVLAMTRACECVKTLQAKIEDLEQEKTTLIKLGQEDSRYINLLSETQSLRTKIEELTQEVMRLHFLEEVYPESVRKRVALQVKVEELTAALTKIRDHKSPHLGSRDHARKYIAEQVLKQEQDETVDDLVERIKPR